MAGAIAARWMGSVEGQAVVWKTAQTECTSYAMGLQDRDREESVATEVCVRRAKPDLALSQIAARFTRHDVEWSRGAFMIIDRRTANPIARLRPIPDTDRFELFYWSNVKGRWTTFGKLGRMKLMLESAHEIVEIDPMFRIPRGR